MTLFDETETKRRRDIGMQLAADPKAELLAIARSFAVVIAKEKGCVTSDDVAELMHHNGMEYSALGNAAGSVFTQRFTRTDQVVASRRPASHGHLIRVWRLA